MNKKYLYAWFNFSLKDLLIILRNVRTIERNAKEKSRDWQKSVSKPHSLIRVSKKLKSNASCVIVSVALSIQNNFKVEWHNEKRVSDEFCFGKICVRVDRGNSVFVFYFWKLICLYCFHQSRLSQPCYYNSLPYSRFCFLKFQLSRIDSGPKI